MFITGYLIKSNFFNSFKPRGFNFLLCHGFRLVVIFLLIFTVLESNAKGIIGVRGREYIQQGFKIFVVDSVMFNSPAYIGGVMKGDRIYGVNGKPIPLSGSLTSVLSKTAIGTVTELWMIRDLTHGKVKVKVFHSIEYEILIKRNDYFFGGNDSGLFKVVINGDSIGVLRWAQDVSFKYMPTWNESNEVVLTALGVEGDPRRARLYFERRPGYLPVLSYDVLEGGKSTFKIAQQITDAKADEIFIDSLRKLERSIHNEFLSENTIAPEWFKQAHSQTLDQTFKTKNTRDSIFRKLVLCPPILRVLAFLLVLYVLLLIGSPQRQYYLFILPIGAVLLIPVSVMLSWLLDFLVYAFSGGNEKIAFEFIYFLLLCLGCLVLVCLGLTGFFKSARSSKEPLTKTLYWILFLINGFGFIKTLIDIIRFIGGAFGQHFTIFDKLNL